MQTIHHLRNAMARFGKLSAIALLVFAFGANSASATVVLGYDASLDILIDSDGDINPSDLIDPVQVPDNPGYALIGLFEYINTALPPEGFDASSAQSFVLDYSIEGFVAVDPNKNCSNGIRRNI